MKVNNHDGLSVLHYGTEKKAKFLSKIEEFSEKRINEISLNQRKNPDGVYGDNLIVDIERIPPVRILGADMRNNNMVVNGTGVAKLSKNDEGIEAKIIENLN